jgi:hypothetical protein
MALGYMATKSQTWRPCGCRPHFALAVRHFDANAFAGRKSRRKVNTEFQKHQGAANMPPSM